jgi:cytochrome c oxidase cbb3-type subunit 2
MPAYPWLAHDTANAADIEAKMRALRAVGVPYSDDQIATAREELAGKSEMDALIAYLQVLGTALKPAKQGG